jgi:hypothetical protein
LGERAQAAVFIVGVAPVRDYKYTRRNDTDAPDAVERSE